MSINCVSSASTTTSQAAQSNEISPARKLRQDFDTLAQALSSSNLAGAQQAFATFQQDLQSIPQSKGTQQSAAAQQTNPVGQANPQDALAALSQALSSGDVSSAQSAFTNLLQDLQSQAGATHHHGHHHHGGDAQPAAASTTAVAVTSTAPTTTVDTTA